jgi:hypothetical protein
VVGDFTLFQLISPQFWAGIGLSQFCCSSLEWIPDSLALFSDLITVEPGPDVAGQIFNGLSPYFHEQNENVIWEFCPAKTWYLVDLLARCSPEPFFQWFVSSLRFALFDFSFDWSTQSDAVPFIGTLRRVCVCDPQIPDLLFDNRIHICLVNPHPTIRDETLARYALLLLRFLTQGDQMQLYFLSIVLLVVVHWGFPVPSL